MNGALDDQEGEDSVKPRYTYIPGGLYTPAGQSNFSHSHKFGWGIKGEGGEGGERMAEDEGMAKVKETEWRDGVSPYSRSEIDRGVLELSKPDR